MDLYLKRMLLMATALCVLGVAASWARGAARDSQQDRVEYLDGPTVVSISAMINGYGSTQLYRVWSDGLTEHSRKLNGSDTYTAWEVIAE